MPKTRLKLSTTCQDSILLTLSHVDVRVKIKRFRTKDQVVSKSKLATTHAHPVAKKCFVRKSKSCMEYMNEIISHKTHKNSVHKTMRDIMNSTRQDLQLKSKMIHVILIFKNIPPDPQ